MQCSQCGGPMMPETVITLRRNLIGFRETRSQGAYCATCRIGVPVEDAVPHRVSIMADLGRSVRRLLPSWRRIGISRSAGTRLGATSAAGPVSRHGQRFGTQSWLPPRHHRVALQPSETLLRALAGDPASPTRFE